MTIKPSEVATVVVQGRRFDDWESVFVQDGLAEGFPVFRFTAAERDPIPALWEKLQFKPGDECAIYLGGHLAISGVILVRQTAYDASHHGVMLQGAGITWYAARGSIIDKDGNYDGMTFEEVARKVIAPARHRQGRRASTRQCFHATPGVPCGPSAPAACCRAQSRP